MTTFERFYFNKGEIEVTGGGSRNDWHLMFVPDGDDGIYLKISTLDQKTFKALLEHIQSVGNALLDASESKVGVPEDGQ